MNSYRKAGGVEDKKSKRCCLSKPKEPTVSHCQRTCELHLKSPGPACLSGPASSSDTFHPPGRALYQSAATRQQGKFEKLQGVLFRWAGKPRTPQPVSRSDAELSIGEYELKVSGMREIRKTQLQSGGVCLRPALNSGLTRDLPDILRVY